MDRVSSDAEGTGFVEQDRFDGFTMFGSADDREHDAGSIFFHLCGDGVDIEGTGFDESFSGVADRFATDIIEVGFEQADGVGFGRGDG